MQSGRFPRGKRYHRGPRAVRRIETRAGLGSRRPGAELMRIMRSNALLSGALGLGGPGALAVGGIGGFPGTSPVTSLLGGTPPAPTAAGLQLLSPPLVHVPPILQQAQAQMMDVHVLASVEGAAPAAAPTAAIAPNLPRGTEIGAVDETSTSAAARARAPSPGLPPKKRRRASET